MSGYFKILFLAKKKITSFFYNERMSEEPGDNKYKALFDEIASLKGEIEQLKNTVETLKKDNERNENSLKLLVKVV